MGRREIEGCIFMVLMCSSMAISSALQQIFSTESNYHQKSYRDGFTNHVGRRNSASGIRVAHGTGSGRAAGGGGGENGGGSRPHTGGGTAVIPIYAAGSSQAHHHQGRPHNSGNRQENKMGILIAAVLVTIAHLYRVF